MVSTDPPYYDNIGYADLSDFFYVWLRPALCGFPKDSSNDHSPKAEELVATPFRHGSKDEAEAFFLEGHDAGHDKACRASPPRRSRSIYYAFKQSNTADDATSSTGWETFLTLCSARDSRLSALGRSAVTRISDEESNSMLWPLVLFWSAESVLATRPQFPAGNFCVN